MSSTKRLSVLPFVALAAVLAFASGCAPAHTQQINDRARWDLASAKIDVDQNVVKLHCENGVDLAPGCGLVLAHIATEQFRQHFRETKCAGKSDEECQSLLEHAIDTTLRQRYWGADRDGVEKTCEAEPGRCNDPLAYETDLLTSHNMHVLVDASNRTMEVEDTRDAAHRADRAQAQAKTFLLLGILAKR